MKYKKILTLALTLIMAVSVCACKTDTGNDGKNIFETENNNSTQNNETEASDDTENEAETNSISVTDMVGRKVEIHPGSYEHVVCVGAGALRMYSYIGDVTLLSGIEDIDNTSLEDRPMMFDSVARPYVIAYEDIFTMLPSCGMGGPMAQAAEAEKILTCEPDIIISEFEDADKSDALQEQLGVPVITLMSGPNGVFDDAFKTSLRLLGTIFDENEKAESLIAFIEGEADEITRRTANIPEEDKPNVYICGLGNWGTTNHRMTAQEYMPFKIANVKNVITGLQVSGMHELEEEKFVELSEQMDLMIMDAAAVKNIAPLYAEDPSMFDTCKAWQNGEVYLQMAYNAYYTNYEIALANAWYTAKVVYPHLFEDIDMTKKTNEITNAFFGQELASEIFSYPSSFGGYQQIDTKNF